MRRRQAPRSDREILLQRARQLLTPTQRAGRLLFLPGRTRVIRCEAPGPLVGGWASKPDSAVTPSRLSNPEAKLEAWRPSQPRWLTSDSVTPSGGTVRRLPAVVRRFGLTNTLRRL